MLSQRKFCWTNNGFCGRDTTTSILLLKSAAVKMSLPPLIEPIPMISQLPSSQKFMEKWIRSHSLAWNQAPDLGRNLVTDQPAAQCGEQSPRATSWGRLPVDSVETPHPWGVALGDTLPRADEYMDNYAWIHIPGEGVQSPGQTKMARVFSYCYYVSIQEYSR